MYFQKLKAFTLIELLITLVILTIVLVIAVPSFYTLIQNSRSIATSNSLLFCLKLARSEAIKRGVSVSICPTTDNTFTSCGTDWTKGWIIFVNPDQNSTFSNNTTEPLIRGEQLTGSNYNISVSPNNTTILTYQSSGFAAAGTSNVTFTISATGCKTDHARSLSISTTGRTSVNNINCP